MGPYFMRCALPTSPHPTYECVPHTHTTLLPTTLTLSLRVAPLLLEKAETSFKKWKFAFKARHGPLLGQCAPLTLPLHPPHIPSFHSHSNPKSYVPSFTGVPLGLDFDICQRSKRGLFASC
jgi:hypothetical protein